VQEQEQGPVQGLLLLLGQGQAQVPVQGLLLGQEPECYRRRFHHMPRWQGTKPILQ
jgi:hypothetical protein